MSTRERDSPARSPALGKLVTSHDRYHAHKILGVCALVSFAWHYGVVWPRTGSLGAGWPVIWLHVALSLSGLQFRVPQKRIEKWPAMIWEEYRLHAVVFSFRAPVVAALDGFWRLLGIGMVHVAADQVTVVHGQPGSTTVRGEHARPKSARTVAMTRAYAVYQHLALASHLVGNNSMDLAYNAFIAVQSSAFCMTLHRKGLIGWKGHAIAYLVCLILSGAFIVQSLRWWQTALALLCGYGRMQGLPKYGLWLTYWGVVMTVTGL